VDRHTGTLVERGGKENVSFCGDGKNERFRSEKIGRFHTQSAANPEHDHRTNANRASFEFFNLLFRDAYSLRKSCLIDANGGAPGSDP
jgi:hypothetical protein